MSDEPILLLSLADFLFNTPLYAKYKTDRSIVEQLYGRVHDANLRTIPTKIDGHCYWCQKQSTFTVSGASVPNGLLWDNIETRFAYDKLYIVCARNDKHVYHYWFEIRSMVVQKIGQIPSLADIANEEVSDYRKGLNKLDAQEFHKAIGLAAHGVGVGSFVYLRRVFERLIYSRFDEFKNAENWDEVTFKNMRMSEKVKFLKGHLPDFLVENAKIYSILSVGIHELDEDTCLKNFDVLKSSIFMILEDDKKKKEELDLRKKFSNAITAMGNSEDSGENI